MKLVVFFSWQMQTETGTNKYFIKDAIERSLKVLRKERYLPEIEIELQEGITGEPGHKPVADTITKERIPNCDIYIADLTIVEKLPKLLKRINRFFKHVTRQKHNENVIHEWGIARERLGDERIILIQNTYYNDLESNDPENQIYDARHLRHPIQYHFDPKATEKKKEVRDNLVTTLTEAIKLSAKAALLAQSKKLKPFFRWKEWEKQFGECEAFHVNPYIDSIISDISSPKGGDCIRIAGLSGIGKTRLLIECFRPNENDMESIARSGKILYYNCSVGDDREIDAVILDLLDSGDERIIILDNCAEQIHRRIQSQIRRRNSRIALISVTSDPEEFVENRISNTEYILLNPEKLSSVVEDIINSSFSNFDGPIIDKIRSFAAGIPMMATLLGESAKDGEQFIGRLSDKDLLSKILGPGATNHDDRNYLKAISLFSFVGYESEKKSQIEFLATNANLTPNNGERMPKITRCYELCQRYIRRSVLEQKGRYIALRPFPLAIHLAHEWLDPCTSERFGEIIKDISALDSGDRRELIESMCERMKYLGFMPNAVEFVALLVKESGPFGKAEVILSELGSRLFRSFVEVNPIAISRSIYGVISCLTHEQLKEIKASRRNLISTLQVTCFDARTFEESSKSLCELAVAENEQWSNNATGIFTSLFKVYLSGTEVSLDERVKLIDWVLSCGPDYYSIAMQCIDAGFEVWHFNRMVGAEKQGTRQLRDYNPSNMEIKKYHADLVSKLSYFLELPETFEKASQILANKMRPICLVNNFEFIFNQVEKVASKMDYTWPEGLYSLKNILKNPDSNLSPDGKALLESLLSNFAKDDFLSRYQRIASPDYRYTDEVYDSEAATKNMAHLAEEFIARKLNFADHLQFFISGNHYFSYSFGKYLGDGSGPQFASSCIRESLKIVAAKLEDEDFNPGVICGLFSTIEDEFKTVLLKHIRSSPEYLKILPILVAMDENGKSNFDLLFSIEDEVSASSWIHRFRHSVALSNCDSKELIDFIEKILSLRLEPNAILTLFDITFNQTYNKVQRKHDLLPTMANLISECIKCDILEKIDAFRISESITEYLMSFNDLPFVELITNYVLDHPRLLHHDYPKKIFVILLDKYYEIVFPRLKTAVCSNDYLKVFSLEHAIGSRIGEHSNCEAVFDGARMIRIIGDCADDYIAATRFAKLVPIFADNNKMLGELSVAVKELLKQFGSNDAVLNAIHSNMESYTWVGSQESLCDAKITALSKVSGQFNPKVTAWIGVYVSSLHETISDIKRSEIEDERWRE